MLLKDLKPKTVTILWIVGAVFDSIVVGTVVAWLLLDGVPDHIAFVLMLSAGPTFLALSFFFYWMASRPARYQSLLQRGHRGMATVKAAHMTGARINAMPVLKLDLEVNVPGRPPYPATDRILAYPGSIERDATFECVVDPNDPRKVVVMHEQSVLSEPSSPGPP